MGAMGGGFRSARPRAWTRSCLPSVGNVATTEKKVLRCFGDKKSAISAIGADGCAERRARRRPASRTRVEPLAASSTHAQVRLCLTSSRPRRPRRRARAPPAPETRRRRRRADPPVVPWRAPEARPGEPPGFSFPSRARRLGSALPRRTRARETRRARLARPRLPPPRGSRG